MARSFASILSDITQLVKTRSLTELATRDLEALCAYPDNYRTIANLVVPYYIEARKGKADYGVNPDDVVRGIPQHWLDLIKRIGSRSGDEAVNFVIDTYFKEIEKPYHYNCQSILAATGAAAGSTTGAAAGSTTGAAAGSATGAAAGASVTTSDGKPEYGACSVRGVAGTCKNTADCTGYSTPGFCLHRKEKYIQCCTPTKPTASSGGGGGIVDGGGSVGVKTPVMPSTGKMPWEEPTVEEKTTSWGLVALVVGGAALAGALVWRYKKGGNGKSRRRRSR